MTALRGGCNGTYCGYDSQPCATPDLCADMGGCAQSVICSQVRCDACHDKTTEAKPGDRCHQCDLGQYR